MRHDLVVLTTQRPRTVPPGVCKPVGIPVSLVWAPLRTKLPFKGIIVGGALQRVSLRFDSLVCHLVDKVPRILQGLDQ
jgi:hypothetical protein